MSRTNSAIARRLSLMTGSSLGVAGMVIAASLGLALAPTPAQAANECGNPNTNGSAPDVFACPSPPTSYTSGINYTSNGNLTLNVGAGVVSFGTGGLVATAGNLTDALTATTTATTILSTSTATGTRAPAVIDLLSQNGDVTVQAGNTVGGAPAFVQYAIRARSTGTGDVTINSTAGNIQTGTGTTDAGRAAIFASSGGGDITITKSTGSITGRLYGIQAQASGAGAISIQTAGNITTSTAAAVAGIEAISGSGDISIELGATLNIGSSSATGIVTQTAGDVTVLARTIQGGAANGVNPGWAMRSSGAGSVTLTLQGPAPTSTLNPLAVTGLMQGAVDFSGLAGGSTINLTENSAWEITKDSIFGAGDDVVNIASGAYLHLYNFRTTSVILVTDDSYTLDFAGGNNRVSNDGTIIVGVGESVINGSRQLTDVYEGELRLEGLSTFENSGTIFLGGFNPQLTSGVARIITTDGWHDDILAMPGADFIGGDGSRIVLDAFFNGTGQDQCDSSLRNADGDLPGADCVDLRGGSASGQTQLSIHDENLGDRGAYNPDGTVLVDVNGGTATADAFVLASDSTNYSAKAGGVIDKGLFVYAVGYDEENQQFKLYGVANDVAQQYPLLAQASNELWRTGIGGWFDHRRGDLIGGERSGELGGGVWVHVTGATVKRDVEETVTAGTTVLDFDNGYSQRNTTVTTGADLLTGSAASMSWGLGAMVGYNRGEVEFSQSANSANLEGAHAGVYGGLTAGPFFVDAVLNGAWLTLDSDAPILNLVPTGTMASTTVFSFGGQVEAGWRVSLGQADIAPLASLSYVKSSLEDMNVPAADPTRIGGNIEYEDAKSVRGGLGARLSMWDLAPSVAPVSFSLTAKAIWENDGVAAAQIGNVGPIAAPVSDTLDGTFGEVMAVVVISDPSQTAAGVLNLGAMLGDSYQNLSASLGLRYQW